MVSNCVYLHEYSIYIHYSYIVISRYIIQSAKGHLIWFITGSAISLLFCFVTTTTIIDNYILPQLYKLSKSKHQTKHV